MMSLALRGIQRASTSSGFVKVLAAPHSAVRCFPSSGSNSYSLVLSRSSHAAGPLTATQTRTHGKQKHEDHVSHWKVDRVVDVLLLPIIPLAFMTDNVYANYALILCVGAHTHWGMESIVVDYLRPRVVGKAGYYAGLGAMYLLSFATFAGLIYLNYSQMPPTKAIKKLWREV